MPSNKNIFFLFGDEDYLVEQETFSLAKDFFDSQDFKQQIEYFTPDNSKPSSLKENICTSSLFSSKRFLVVSGFDEDEYDEILSSYENIPPDTLLIISEGKLDKRSSVYKKLQKIAVIKEMKQYAEWETDKLSQWIIEKFAQNGKSIGKKAAELMIGISGTSLRALSSEIDKITTFCSDKELVAESDIMQLASDGEMSAFAIENAIAVRDIRSAVSAVNAALRSKERPEVILGKIAGRIRTYLEIKSLLQEGMHKNGIIAALSMNPYYFERCESAAKQYTLTELCESVKSLHKADLALKTTAASPQIVFELLFTDLMGNA